MFVCFLKAGPQRDAPLTLLSVCNTFCFSRILNIIWEKVFHIRTVSTCEGTPVVFERTQDLCKTISRQMSSLHCVLLQLNNTSAALNNFPSPPVNKYTRPGNYSGYNAPNRYLNTDFSISAPVGNLLKPPLYLHLRGIPTNSQRYHYPGGFPKNLPSKIVWRWNCFLLTSNSETKKFCTHTHILSYIVPVCT